MAAVLSGLQKEQYKILNDIMLRTDYGTTQIDHVKFIPIVAFSGNSDIKVKTQKPVVYIGQLKRVIKEYKDIKFQESELDMLVAKVQSANITTKEVRKEHVKQIRTKVKDSNTKVAAGICPRCGGQLVERKGKNGVFTGCSNYPKCRYTKS